MKVVTPLTKMTPAEWVTFHLRRLHETHSQYELGEAFHGKASFPNAEKLRARMEAEAVRAEKMQRLSERKDYEKMRLAMYGKANALRMGNTGIGYDVANEQAQNRKWRAKNLSKWLGKPRKTALIA